LYRLSGARDNNAGYIYTKPSSETKITHRDKVFVLSTNDEVKKIYRNDDKKHEGFILDVKRKSIKEEKVNEITNNKIKEKELGENNNEDYFENRNKNSPFNYIKEQLYEIDKEINKLQDFLDIMKVEYKENISSGIKEEINSLLQQY